VSFIAVFANRDSCRRRAREASPGVKLIDVSHSAILWGLKYSLPGHQQRRLLKTRACTCSPGQYGEDQSRVEDLLSTGAWENSHEHTTLIHCAFGTSAWVCARGKEHGPAMNRTVDSLNMWKGNSAVRVNSHASVSEEYISLRDLGTLHQRSVRGKTITVHQGDTPTTQAGRIRAHAVRERFPSF
jgi:hypothetical protein